MYKRQLKDNKTYDIHGDTYSDHDLVRIKPHIDRPANLSVSGLDSICLLYTSAAPDSGDSGFPPGQHCPE